ncbi:MAG: 4Fe-4S dicluster domain-containing protein [Pirellulaceae bacterium]|nr:4Fe-4S dicluster domain-containing protein [Pirellulaceae bacterium]
MNESRREFLKKVGYAAAGAGCTFPLLAAAGSALTEDEHAVASGSGGTQWCMVVDIQKCMSPEVRDACSQACHEAHNVPEIPVAEHEVKWIWTEQYQNAFPDQSSRRTEHYAHAHATDPLNAKPVLVLCNHCTEPPCTKVCPTIATWRREEDGIVMMDMHRCIGCRYCVAACPYGARSFNWSDPREHAPLNEGKITPGFPTRSKGVVEKCNFCAERLRDDGTPACVEAANKVPGGDGALTFGNLADPSSDVCRLLAKEHTIVRKPSLGTSPNVFYILPKEIEDTSGA